MSLQRSQQYCQQGETMNNTVVNTATSNPEVIDQSPETPVDDSAVNAPPATETEPVTDPNETLRQELRDELEKELSTKYAKLGRRETALKQQLSQMTQQQSEYEKTQELANKYKQLEELKGQSKGAVLSELGISYDDLVTEYVSGELTPQADPKMTAIEKELEAVKARLEQEDKQRQQAALQEQEKQVQHFVESKVKEVGANLVANIEGGYDLVQQAAQTVFNETGELPPIEEIIEQIETHYKSQFDYILDTDYGKSKFDDRYKSYVAEKQKERESSTTITNKAPPAPAPANTSDKEFPGKGTKEGLRYLMELRKQENN